jgi:predicted Zn-dependent peptidase
VKANALRVRTRVGQRAATTCSGSLARPCKRRVLLGAALTVLLFIMCPCDGAAQPNPFADFESFRLPNGMRVWYRHLPGATTTSMAVIVPVGRDHDPPGFEQTAHLLEHVLLSDRDGGAEADLARELVSRGGSSNAVTAADRMYFTVHIGSEEAAYALQWLFGVVSPRTFSDAVVARSRVPVAIETGARRRTALERIALHYLHWPRLRPHGFWQREFGMTVPPDQIDSGRTLARISAVRVQQFHDTHFSPAQMTLVIATGQPRSIVIPLLDRTFALLPWRPVPAPADSASPKHGESRRFSWHAGGSTTVNVMFRVREMQGRDQLRLIFIEDLLRHRLMERLRRGVEKTVYSVAVTTETRRDAALVRIAADVDPRTEYVVRSIIEDELQRLRTAVIDTVAFYADRDLLSRRLRVQNAAPAALVAWATDRFHDPRLHDAFPDPGEYYATVGPDSIGALAQRVFAPHNRIVRIRRTLPLPLPWIAGAGFALIIATVLAWRRAMFRPADMSAIRYIARIRLPPGPRIVLVAFAAMSALISVRLVAAGIHFAAEYAILSRDSPLIHAGAAALIVILITLAALATAGLTIHKVLVFDHEVRLKSRTYRSIILPAGTLRGARIVHRRRDLRLRRVALPVFGDAVFLELRSGGGYLLHVRRPDLLHTAVNRIVSAAAPDSTAR